MHGQCDPRPMVAFPAAGHRRCVAGTDLYCSVTEAYACEQLAQGCIRKRGDRDLSIAKSSALSTQYATEPRRYLLHGDIF